MISKKNLIEFESKIGVKFKNIELLEQAFVHRSYLNEHPNFKLGHNERLEFLGDAVLELIVTEQLYQQFPNRSEGDLTSLRSSIVRGAMLARIARDLDASQYLFCSKGEEKSGGKAREFILANTFEAIVGALYLDQGYNGAGKFVKKFLLFYLNEIIEKELYRDPKSTLQEWAQEKKSVTPHYSVIKESGPDHNKVFMVGVYLNKELLAKGSGSSKQKAEEDAATKAIGVFKI